MPKKTGPKVETNFDTPSLTNLLVEIMQPLFVLVAETNNKILGLESCFKISFLSPKIAQ